MYWQDHYKTPAHAVRALQAVQRGQLRMTPNQLHIAHVAARSKLSGISEDPSNLGASYGLTELPHNLGSISSFLKKAVKVATKLSPSHAVAHALKIDKFSPSQMLVNKITATKKSAPKTPPALTTEVLPNAPAQPIPALPDPSATSPMSFAQGSSGGGGGGIPAPVPGDAVAEESSLSLPIMIGIGAAGLLVLYLLMRKGARR